MSAKNQTSTEKYLVEKSLKDWLSIIYPGHQFIHNKQVPDSGIKNRPDYRNDDLMLIVEFDGYQHYTKTATIIADNLKDQTYSRMGYKIIRIPYWLQMSTDTICFFFGKIVKVNQEYEHGFISDDCCLPADFCSLGLDRFQNELKDVLKYCPSLLLSDILESFSIKINKLGNRDLVLPPNF